MHGSMGSEELDSLIDVLLAILFMIFCAFGTAYMVASMSRISQHYHTTDKLEIDADAQAEMDPFYFTGFQTYMFAYMMDPYSDQPLTWLGGPDYPVTSRIDGTDNYHVTICALDTNGEVRPNFLAWRNQMITGGTITGGTGRDVKSVVRSPIYTDYYRIYQGSATRNVNGVTKKLRWHLELTDKYINNFENVYSHIGHTLVERRKIYQWVLVPSYP